MSSNNEINIFERRNNQKLRDETDEAIVELNRITGVEEVELVPIDEIARSLGYETEDLRAHIQKNKH